MPIIKHDDAKSGEVFPGVSTRYIVNRETGSTSTTVRMATLNAGSRMPLHTHNTEESIVIVEGTFEATVGDEKKTVTPGYTVLVPAGVRHFIANKGSKPGRILAIFPTADVQTNVIK